MKRTKRSEKRIGKISVAAPRRLSGTATSRPPAAVSPNACFMNNTFLPSSVPNYDVDFWIPQGPEKKNFSANAFSFLGKGLFGGAFF